VGNIFPASFLSFHPLPVLGTDELSSYGMLVYNGTTFTGAAMFGVWEMRIWSLCICCSGWTHLMEAVRFVVIHLCP
jgi:hypothetical protein